MYHGDNAMITMGKAIRALQPNAEFSYDDEDYSTLRWNTPEITIPTKEEIELKVKELEAAEPMRLLRKERDKKLSETDWWTIRSNDTGVSLTQEQKDYKQALRDLPSTASPTLVNGMLSNVTWPEKPE